MGSSDSAHYSRRKFLRATAVSAAALAVDSALAQAGHRIMSTSSNAPTLPRRPYGSTGLQLSIIGMGGDAGGYAGGDAGGDADGDAGGYAADDGADDAGGGALVAADVRRLDVVIFPTLPRRVAAP